MKRVSKIIWSSRTEKERDALLKECDRVARIGGSFSIETIYTTDWHTVYTIDYPETVDTLEK